MKLKRTKQFALVNLVITVKKQFGEVAVDQVSAGASPDRQEAISALVALGFNKITVQKTVNKILRENEAALDAEAIIRLALKHLS